MIQHRHTISILSPSNREERRRHSSDSLLLARSLVNAFTCEHNCSQVKTQKKEEMMMMMERERERKSDKICSS